MTNMLLFIFLLVIHGVSAAETNETEYLSVTEGDAVTLQSDLSEIQNDDTILWMFGPKDTLICQIRRKDDLTPIHFPDDERFRGRLQVDQKTGSLTIRNTRIRHSGQYKLTVSREQTKTKIFNVTVFAVVAKTDGVKSVSLSVMEGDPVTLQADSEKPQDALMLWRFGDKGVLLAKIDFEANESSLNDADEGFKDRLQLNDQTGSLTIKNTRITDSGLYELQIKGREGSQRFLVSVSVEEKTVMEGETLTLHAGLTGTLGDVTIQWCYETEDNLIAGISNGLIRTEEGADGRFRGKLKLDGQTGDLTISTVRIIHSGLYKLKISSIARNTKYKRFTVNVEEKKTVMEGETLTLHAGLTGTLGDVTIQWCYETEDNLIAEISKGLIRTEEGADGRFRSKLKLDGQTGDLTISNIRTIHSGLYKLKISSSSTGAKYKKFTVSVNVKSVPVTMGGSVTLQTNAEIQSGDLILWTFGAENLLVKVDLGMTSINKRFRDRLELDNTTGSLTIRDIKDTDSGHFKLQIINREQTTFRRFNVTVNDGDSTENQVNESVTEVMPLLSENVPNGANELEETSSL